MSYLTMNGGSLAPPPVKHWERFTSTFAIPQGPSAAPPRPRRLPPGMPFDPAELVRRLEIVERKQIARDKAKAAQDAVGSKDIGTLTLTGKMHALSVHAVGQQIPQPYHHVPSQAAELFQCTAANESIRGTELADKSSVRKKVKTTEKALMKEYAQISTVSRSNNVTPSATTADHAKPRSQSRSVDANTPLKGATDESPRASVLHYAHYHSATSMGATKKRSSKGSFDVGGKTRNNWLLLSLPPAKRSAESKNMNKLEKHEEKRKHPRWLNQGATINEHRVDWTQHDETIDFHGEAKVRSPKLKKADSIWTLRGRLGSLGRHHYEKEKDGRSEDMISIKKSRSDGDTLTACSVKSPRNGFFSRFKRQ